MAREIKFRVFFGGEMRTDISFGDYANEGIKKMQKDMPLMQYTGLKDSNGVEIYEGDVVKGVGNSINKVDGIGLVAWVCGGFVNRVGDFNYMIHDVSAKSLEVIGNIHQNPELLKN